MKVSTRQRVCSSLIKDMNNGKISLEHRLQRKEVWSTKQKALLIDSILKGYALYPIFMIEEKNRRYVIDGVQRLSAIRDYMDNKFRLTRDCGPITTLSEVEQEDGSKIVRPFQTEVAGKLFKRLDEEFQERIAEYELTVLTATEFTDEEVREMFRRLNNGSALNNVQKNVVDYSYDFVDACQRCLEHEFWRKTAISNSDIRKDKNREVLLQCLYVVSGEEIMGFKDSNIHPFAKRIQTEDYKELFNSIYDIADTFNDVITERLPNFNKMSIAPVFAGAEVFAKKGENGYKVYDAPKLLAYADKIQSFFKNDYETSEYAEALKNMGGSAGRENVLYRINFFTEMAKTC